MSQQNVEIVKAWFDAYNREDWDALFKDVAPGLEVDFSRSVGPLAGVFGVDQALRLLKEFREAWESARMEPHEFIEAGDLVVVHGWERAGGRPRPSVSDGSYRLQDEFRFLIARA